MDVPGGPGDRRVPAVPASAFPAGLVVAASSPRARGERDAREADRARLARQAKVTPNRARKAALAAVPGTVVALRLQREGGTVRYRVTVQPQGSGTLTDVHVDAATGKVIAIEPAN